MIKNVIERFSKLFEEMCEYNIDDNITIYIQSLLLTLTCTTYKYIYSKAFFGVDGKDH